MGLDRPTLQGLCTWGLVAKAVVDGCLCGDVDAIRDYRATFTGIVFPGETLEVRVSTVAQAGTTTISADVIVVERDAPAMSATVRANG